MHRWMLSLCLLALALPLRAHLCNDVFAQARDNLAVKVDIRDGQLRINQEASFRVYLLNTMDRAIADIRLEVVSKDFDGVVQPSPDWKGFPGLQTSLHGGQKEFFSVTLKRKSGTADGKYDIGLRLYNGQKPAQEFKTVGIADAMAVVKVPKAPATLKVDGVVQRADWAGAVLCTDFQAEAKEGQFIAKQAPDPETRVRISADGQNLYALVTTPAAGANDKVSFFLATDAEAKPRRIDLNLTTGALTDAPATAVSKVSADGIEVQIPLRELNLGKTFFLNLAHEKNGVPSFWRGGAASLQNPIVYANLILAD